LTPVISDARHSICAAQLLDLEQTQTKRVILINEALARKHFPNEDPIGQRLDVQMFENPTRPRSSAVVGNVRYDSLIDERRPRLLSASGSAYSFMTLVDPHRRRSGGDAPAVQREIRARSESACFGRAHDEPGDVGMGASLAFQHAAARTLRGLATVALSRRHLWRDELLSRSAHRELGLRLAVGAQPRQVLLLVLKQGFALTNRWRRCWLWRRVCADALTDRTSVRVAAVTLTTFATISLLLVIVSLLACYLPARRAMRIDPLSALRYE
jgi:putative ABC transport system permease protein